MSKNAKEKVNKDRFKNHKQIIQDYFPEEKWEESDELVEMLRKAHKMLVDINLPVADLDSIYIAYMKMRKHHKNHAAFCFNRDNSNVIFVSSDFKQERNPKKLVLEIILHELVHLCSKDGASWHPSHDKQFITWGQSIIDHYGINVMAGGKHFEYSYKPVVVEIKCPCCPAIAPIHEGDKKFLQKHIKYMNMPSKPRYICPYCSSKMDAKVVRHDLLKKTCDL